MLELAKSFDEAKDHSTQLQSIVDALPDEPKAARLSKNAAKKNLGELLVKLKLFGEVRRLLLFAIM